MKIKKLFMSLIIIFSIVLLSSCSNSNAMAFKVNDKLFSINQIENTTNKVTNANPDKPLAANQLIPMVYLAILQTEFFKKENIKNASNGDLKKTMKEVLPNLNFSPNDTLINYFLTYLYQTNVLQTMSQDKHDNKIVEKLAPSIDGLIEKNKITLNKRYGKLDTKTFTLSGGFAPWIQKEQTL